MIKIQPVKSITQAPSLLKLGACLIYDGLIIIALSMLSSAIFIAIFGDATIGVKRLMLQICIWLVLGLYFIVSWTKTGQTLGMRSWQLKLVNQSNVQSLVSYKQAVFRYMLATVSMLSVVGFLWCIVQPNRRFLHDQWLKTSIISIKQ